MKHHVHRLTFLLSFLIFYNIVLRVLRGQSVLDLLQVSIVDNLAIISPSTQSSFIGHKIQRSRGICTLIVGSYIREVGASAHLSLALIARHDASFKYSRLWKLCLPRHCSLRSCKLHKIACTDSSSRIISWITPTFGYASDLTMTCRPVERQHNLSFFAWAKRPKCSWCSKGINCRIFNCNLPNHQYYWSQDPEKPGHQHIYRGLLYHVIQVH